VHGVHGVRGAGAGAAAAVGSWNSTVQAAPTGAGHSPPFADPTLAYTVTPATMMIGYQGLPYLGGAADGADGGAVETEEAGEVVGEDVLSGCSIDHAALMRMATAYAAADPALSAVSDHLEAHKGRAAPGAAKRLVRAGFVSSCVAS